MTAWRTIESAPTDGTAVLTAYDVDTRAQVAISRYVAAPNGPNAPGYWSPAYRASHWMPLPAPPASAKRPDAD